MTSVIFVIANLLILSFIFGGDLSIVLISFGASFAALGAVAAVVWIGVPKDILIIGGKERKRVLEIPYLLTLASIAAILWIAVLYIFYIINLDPYLMIILSGTLLLIPGTIYKRISEFVKGIDEDFPVFARMYGSNLSIIPSPLKALEPLIGVLFGRIALAARRLHTLLANNISFATALREFAKASKSELIRRASIIMGDSLKYGGNMSKVGLVVSDLTLMVNRTRRRRYQIHKTFESSVYALHMTNVLLISFITVLMNMFSKVLVQIKTLIPFYALPASLVNYIGVSVAVLLTIINAIALTATNGSGKHIMTYYVGLLLLLGGISAYASSIMVNYLLQPVSNIINQTMRLMP
jgi:flagellar protein FlaJ